MSRRKGGGRVGWIAVGFSPARLEEERLAHEKRVQAAIDAGQPVPAPWNEDAFMRRAKPTPLRSLPFEVKSAADEVCALAGRMGWKGCYVTSSGG
jgi:hypothetical protein